MDLSEDEKKVFLAAVSSIASSLISLNEKMTRLTEELCPPNPLDSNDSYTRDTVNDLKEKGLSREEIISNPKVRDCLKYSSYGIMSKLSSINDSLVELAKEV